MKQFLKDIWTALKGHGAEVTVGMVADAPARCASLGKDGAILFHQRHLYLGGEFCRRGCGAKNKDYQPEPVAVPTEG